MNQILTVENKNGKRTNATVDIKKVILVFSIGIIVFGVILLFEGISGLTKSNKKSSKNQGIIIPVETSTPVIPLDDEEKPTIELLLSGETVKIIARDETEIDYISYGWNNEEIQTINANVNEKNKIETSITIKQGVNTLVVKAVDKAGNETEKQQDFKGQVRPVVTLNVNEQQNGVIIEVSCIDGISKIEYTQNGNWTRIPFDEYSNCTKEDWASQGVIVEFSNDGKIINAKYTQKLVEGENRFSVYAYSVEGLVGNKDGVRTYIPVNMPQA